MRRCVDALAACIQQPSVAVRRTWHDCTSSVRGAKSPDATAGRVLTRHRWFVAVLEGETTHPHTTLRWGRGLLGPLRLVSSRPLARRGRV